MHTKSGGLGVGSPPYFGMVSRAPGAAQTPKIGYFRPAQKLCIKNPSVQSFDMDTLRAPKRSPTPISKSNDFPGQSEDIWGARGPHLRSILGVSGARAGLKNTYLFVNRSVPEPL